MHFYYLEVIFTLLILKKNTFGTHGFEILTQALLNTYLAFNNIAFDLPSTRRGFHSDKKIRLAKWKKLKLLIIKKWKTPIGNFVDFKLFKYSCFFSLGMML